MMKNIITLFLALFYLTGLNAQRLVILHTNDIHSRLTGFGPENSYTPLEINNDNTVGGFARLSSLVKNEKKLNPNSVVLCDAGDFLMGTIFQAFENKSGFQLRLMKKIGFDVITLGNHEFDFGDKFISDAINSAIIEDEIPEIVASQLDFSDGKTKDDDLENLFDKGVIKPYTVLVKNGLKIGFFGILGEDAQFVMQSSSSLEFKDVVKASKAITKKLRNDEKVDIIVCLSHSGIYFNKKGKARGEDIKLAKKVPDIDLIISGHSHVETKEYIKVGKTIIVQTGEYLNNLGRLEINYENNQVEVVDFKLIPIKDEIKGDKFCEQAISEYKEKIDNIFFKPYNYSYSVPVAETDFVLHKSYYTEKKPTALGNLITDAVKYYVDSFSTGTDIVMGAQGLIREDIRVGKISIADIFKISPLGRGENDFLGYSLAKIYLTGNDLKRLAELIIFAGKPGENSYMYFSGVKFFFNKNKRFLNKVVEIKVNGQKIDFSRKNKKLYSFTSNMYLLNFITKINKLSKGLVKIYPKDKTGKYVENLNQCLLDFDNVKDEIQEGKEWIAIAEYLKQFQDKDKNGIPEIPEKYTVFEKFFVDINNP